jgi:hypothetical protein
MSDTEQSPLPRMTIPAPGGGCGVVFALLFVGGFVGVFVALAVDNLINYRTTPLLGLIPSALWLALVVFVAGGTLIWIGAWASLVACLGEFALRHFAEVWRDGERTVIGFGFTLFGIRFHYLRIEREQIVSVNMNTGQATAFAGRDMNDWSVLLWYSDPNRRLRRGHVEGIREEVYIVCTPGAKVKASELFAQFVVFLRAAGVELQPSEKENEFRRSDS